MSNAKPAKEKRVKHLSILMTKSERELFRKAAEGRGISTADYFRSAVYEKIAREGRVETDKDRF